MDALLAFGWTDERAAQLAALDRADLVPARVVGEHRGRLDLIAEAGPLAGRVPGRLRHAAAGRDELPAVGDWVAVDAAGAVFAVLPRHGAIARADPSGRSEAQVLAGNVDVALVLGSLNRDLNLRRLERLLALAAGGAVEAVVVLTKADLVPDPHAHVARVAEALGRTVAVIAISAQDGTGLALLEEWLRPGATAALLGSSGVGKTTLLNALSGGSRRTAPVRASDDRGRHATTARELVVLPSGAIVIDTPGIRLPRMWGAELAFDDVEALAAQCRFADCSHEREPGCAVAAAVASGSLPADRVAGWRKLERERARMEARRRGRRTPAG